MTIGQPSNDAALAQLARRIDPALRLLRAWPLAGGVSAQVTALELARADGGTERVVVRQHGAADRRRNPQIAADEHRLLQLLHALGLPVPQPRLLDQSCELLPAPYIVVAFIDGQSGWEPASPQEAAAQLAEALARVHRVDGARADLSFLPQQAPICAARLAGRPGEPPDEARVRRALAAAWPFPQRNPPALLHGDYWPGNALWRDGRLAALIDWEDAQVGDPLADVANARLELLWAAGPAAVDAFTRRYMALMPAVDRAALPHWDLWADLRLTPRIGEWGLDRAAERELRDRRGQFVARALAGLAGQ